MIIVEPSSARFEASESSHSSEEHLLERISATENRISRLTERLERSLELLLRQAQNAYLDRSLLKALIGLLTEDDIVQTNRLEQLWSDLCQKDALQHDEGAQREKLRLSILAGSGVRDQTFRELVNEGFLFIEDKQQAQGISKLRRAAEIHSDNSSLNLFLGEHFFRRGNTRLARTYLSKAHDATPEDVRILLLLGLTCADDGELVRAKELLSEATQRGDSSFAVHYALGRLFVEEQDWSHALSEFKQALSTRPSPEAHYVLACVYYQMRRDTLAVRHLKKAIEMDAGYNEAIYLLTIVNSRRSETKPGKGSSAKTRAAVSNSASKVKVDGLYAIAPLFEVGKSRSRLMTGSDKRLARALREDALRSPDSHSPES